MLETLSAHPRPADMMRTTIDTTSSVSRSGVEKEKLSVMTDETMVDVEAVAEMELDGVAPGAELVVEAVGEFVDETRFDMDSEGYVDCDGVIEAVTPSVFVDDGVLLPVLLDVGVGVSEADGVCEVDSVGEFDAVTPRLSVLVGERVGVADWVGVFVLDGVPVAENEGVTVAVGVLNGVPPELSVVVVVLVDDFVGVPVDEGVFVVVPDRVPVLEPVDVLVIDGVCVEDSVSVPEVVADLLCVLVIVCVFEGVTPAATTANEVSFVRVLEIELVAVIDGVREEDEVSVPVIVGVSVMVAEGEAVDVCVVVVDAVPEPVGVFDALSPRDTVVVAVPV